MKLHKTYECIQDMMIPEIDLFGDTVYSYDQAKLGKLLEHTDEPDERIKTYNFSREEGDISLHLHWRDGVEENCPLVFLIHGGGFRSGNALYDLNRLAHITKNVSCKVMTIDYRLVPDYPYPAALEDCLFALNWAVEHADELGIDPTKIAIGGYSAGATLAACTSLYLRDFGGPKISSMILMNPVVSADVYHSASAQQFYKGNPMLSGINVTEDTRLYLPNHRGQTPPYYALPGYCEDYSDLPPAVVVVGEYDPLRDGCIQLASDFMRDRVPCELYVLPRVPHSFDLVTEGCMTSWIWDAVVRALKREFGTL